MIATIYVAPGQTGGETSTGTQGFRLLTAATPATVLIQATEPKWTVSLVAE